MTQEKLEAKKPEIELWYEKPILAYCGSCGRCIWGAIYKKPDICKWCGTPVDWEDR